MATSAEHLILRGLHLILSSTFAPNDPVKQAAHYTRLTQDIGPWMTDYAEEIAKPAVDYTLTPAAPSGAPMTHVLETRVGGERFNPNGEHPAAHDVRQSRQAGRAPAGRT